MSGSFLMDGISCSRLSRSYGKSKALDKVSFSIPHSGIFALIGRNGAGKTTLTRILATELMPSSGSATVDGLDVVRDAAALRESIACLPQEARAIPWMTPKQTVVAYLMYRGFGYGEAKASSAEAISMVGLDDHANVLNSKLSGGQKRKVLLASVLASGARIIFVDEPTTGLDPISRSEIWSMLLRLKKERLIFLTTHYLEEAEKLADSIGILELGRMIGFGTLDRIRQRIKYKYSMKVSGNVRGIKIREGKMMRGNDGELQIVTTEKEAYRLSRQFIDSGMRFSVNQISLDDVFYYYVKRQLGSDEPAAEEEW